MKRLAPLRPLETTWEDWLLGGGARHAFTDPSLPLHVEIGPGDDIFLLEAAERHPDANWLGIEYSRKRVRRYVRRVERELGRPGNLRLIWRPAADLIEPFLTPGEVTTYHIYFPDPWPKAHHARYRMLEPAFVRSLHASLIPGGEVQIATDAEAYAEEMVEAFGTVPGFESLVPVPGYERREIAERITPFEERWRAEGRAILGLRFQAVGSG